MLPGRDQPQYPPALEPSLGHERCRVGELRAAAAASGLAGGQGRPPVPVLHARCHRRHPLPDAQRAGARRALPADFPPAWTVYWRAARWQADGSTETMHDQLRDRVRLAAGRHRLPTAAIIDSQSVKAAEEVARPGRGYDAGKKINGRKRHIAVDVHRAAADRAGHRRQRPGPRRRETAAVEPAQGLSLGEAGLGDRGYAGQARPPGPPPGSSRNSPSRS